jgi:arylsulfatase A-like enzyme
MLNTHRPFPEQEADRADFRRPPAPIPDTPDTRADAARFYRAVRAMDRCVGVVLAALAESGLDANTVVIYTTDHGIAFPTMKATLSDAGAGVALLVRLPAGRGAGRIIEPLTSQLDLFPTLCELTGLPVPAWIRGHSLLPLIEGRQPAPHAYIFTETSFHAAYEPARAIRSLRYKLIEHFSDHCCPLAVNVDDSPSKRLFFRSGYFARERAREQLFDLYLDPAEQDNRRDDPAYRDVYQQLHAELRKWMRRTKDHLLHGPLSPPTDAVLNSPDSYSPSEPLISQPPAH